MYVIRFHDGPQLIPCKILVRCQILDVEGVHNPSLIGPCSAIISDSCDYVGTYVGVLANPMAVYVIRRMLKVSVILTLWALIVPLFLTVAIT